MLNLFRTRCSTAPLVKIRLSHTCTLSLFNTFTPKRCQKLSTFAITTNIFQQLPKVANFCQKLPTFAKSCQLLPKVSISCKNLSYVAKNTNIFQSCQKFPQLVKIWLMLPTFAKSCQKLPKLTNINQKLPTFAKSCLKLQKMLKVANICQHLPIVF